MTTLSTVTMVIDGITYDDIVPKSYRMNPETEDLIYGGQIEDGMIILTAESFGRYNECQPELDNDALIRINRWCEASKLATDTDGAHFIGIYSDGQKAIRFAGKFSGWLVKTNV